MTDTQETPGSHGIAASHDTPEAQAPPAEPAPVEPADVAPSLAALIASIRTAVAHGAPAEARVAGATACRSILTVLEVQRGQPLTGVPPSATPAASPIAALLSQPGFLSKLAAMSREQLLDLLKQVTSGMTPRTSSPTPTGPRFHLIQIPQVRRPDGT